MLRPMFMLSLFALLACGGEKKDSSIYELSNEPVSVRGWILDVKGAQHEQIIDMELARRTQLFQSTSLWVESAQYASGGIAENGAFIVLDVPPRDSIIGFNAPGAQTARLVLKNVPGSADVLIPNLILEPNGATVLDPKLIQVRVPASISKARPTGKTAIVAGHTVPIIETPLGEMANRRDYPQPPGYRPVAIVK